MALGTEWAIERDHTYRRREDIGKSLFYCPGLSGFPSVSVERGVWIVLGFLFFTPYRSGIYKHVLRRLVRVDLFRVERA